MPSVESRDNQNTVDKKVINPTAFHLTGQTGESGLEDINDLELRPALFAGFTDMSTLRYDYPVLLDHYDGGGNFVCSLSEFVNQVLRQKAPSGVEGEFMRSQILNLEHEIRIIAAKQTNCSLEKAWEKATQTLRTNAANGSLELLNQCLGQVEEVFLSEAQLIDCDAAMPMALVRQAWAIDQQTKTQSSRKRIDELILELENILGAGIKKSAQTLLPENLKGSVGTSFEGEFDFDTMSEILTPASPRDVLPEDRRQRIQSVLHTLQSQRFYKSEKWSGKQGSRAGPYSFLFRNAASALKAIHNRVPEMAELTKAISIAELEIANRYEPSIHDSIFAAYNETSLLAEDMAQFPTYLLTLNMEGHDTVEKARVLELLSSGIPVKVLAQTDDILEDLIGSNGQLPFGGVNWQLASMSITLNDVFVMQTGSAGLYKLRDEVWRGVTSTGPALFSVFSGDSGHVSNMSPYLVSAAATESRAFPTFVYDPSKGSDWASRLTIANNPQLESDWPVHTFVYEDEDIQQISEGITFTLIEFIASDNRFTDFFARIPEAMKSNSIVPVDQYLKSEAGEKAQSIPCVWMVDDANRLHSLVVDERLVRTTLRCLDMWHSLQEMGGIRNSHALKLLESERQLWQADKDKELAELVSRQVPETASPVKEQELAPSPLDQPEQQEEAPEVSLDDPFIETVRCTTCNECTDISAQIFAYNDNKQAFILDPLGGTYRQLVEAAENCQVSIIHPGKPKDLSEPNLDELMERAQLFQ